MESLGFRSASALKLASSASVDWQRLISRCLIAAAAALGIMQLVLQASGRGYGYDFRGGTWAAGQALLNGQSPFPAVPEPAYLLAHSNGFITPPLLAVIGAPFSLLPFVPALIAFNLLCVVGLLVALRLLQVRDLGFCVVVLGSFPFIASLGLGQPDGLFALGAAAAWRWRDCDRGAVAAGAIIAAKLLAWPLVLWFLITRRLRQAAVAAASAGVLLGLSWATVGFHGLLTYPALLAADARAFGVNSHSFLTALLRSGLPLHLASALAVLLAVGAAGSVALTGGRTDLGWFTAALTLGILSSPIVWQHYFLLLFIPLAATRRVRDPLLWALSAALWLSPSENSATLVQAWLIPLLAYAIALRIAVLSRSAVSAPVVDEDPVAALAPPVSTSLVSL